MVITLSARAQKQPDFRFDSKGEFVLMQVSDIQDNDKPKARVAAFLAAAIKRDQPGLIVLTGDNTACCNQKGAFEKSVSAFVEVFKARHTPFAVAFGNHDSEKKGTDYYTRDEQYARYKQIGGACFVDYDVTVLSGTGSGVIPIRAAKGDEVRFNLFLMDSGDYVMGGYDGVRGDQIHWYESVAGKIPGLWFQHIPVPDFFDTGLLVAVPTNTPGCVYHKKGEFAGTGYLLDTKRATGLLREVPCPTPRAVYSNIAHTCQGRTLYASWLKMGNIKGAYFGHDHPNTLDGVDTNGIRLGYAKAATLQSYNDNNPGLRLFRIKDDGTYTTLTITESELKRVRPD